MDKSPFRPFCGTCLGSRRVYRRVDGKGYLSESEVSKMSLAERIRAVGGITRSETCPICYRTGVVTKAIEGNSFER